MQLTRSGGAVQRAAHPLGELVEGGCGLPVRHDRGHHPLAEPVVVHPEHRALRHRRVRRQHRFHLRGQHRQAAGADRVIEPSQHLQAPRPVQPADVLGAEPAGLGEGVRGHRIAVAPGQGRPADHDAALPVGRGLVDAHPHTVKGRAVVHAPARGLARSVAAHHRDAGLRGGVEHRPWRRSAAEQDGVESGQGLGRRRILQGLGQLCGHQRGVAPPGPHTRRGGGQAGGVESGADVDLRRNGPGLQAAHQHLDPGDVVGRQGQQPAARAAEAVVGGRRAGDQRGRTEHGALRCSGRPGGGDHQCDVVVDVLTNPQSRCEEVTFP